MTNDEAAAYYGSITRTPIPCGDLENLLKWGGYASRNSVTGAWEGPLVDLMLLNAVPELSEGLDELFTHLNQPRSAVIDTTEQPWAGKMDDLLGGLLVAGSISEDLIGEVMQQTNWHSRTQRSTTCSTTSTCRQSSKAMTTQLSWLFSK